MSKTYIWAIYCLLLKDGISARWFRDRRYFVFREVERLGEVL